MRLADIADNAVFTTQSHALNRRGAIGALGAWAAGATLLGSTAAAAADVTSPTSEERAIKAHELA